MTTTHHDCRRTTDAAAGGRTGAWSQILRISGRRRLRGALREPWSESACSATIRSRRRAGGALWVMQRREMNYLRHRHDGRALCSAGTGDDGAGHAWRPSGKSFEMVPHASPVQAPNDETRSSGGHGRIVRRHEGICHQVTGASTTIRSQSWVSRCLECVLVMDCVPWLLLVGLRQGLVTLHNCSDLASAAEVG